MFCSCFAVFSIKDFRKNGPGEILRCVCGWLAPKGLQTAVLYHICSLSTDSSFACQKSDNNVVGMVIL